MLPSFQVQPRAAEETLRLIISVVPGCVTRTSKCHDLSQPFTAHQSAQAECMHYTHSGGAGLGSSCPVFPPGVLFPGVHSKPGRLQLQAGLLWCLCAKMRLSFCLENH